MKKIFAAVLIAALMVICFTGCSKEEKRSDTGTAIENEQTANGNQTEVGLTLSELTDEQIAIFTATSACFVEDVVSGSMEVEEMDMRQEWMLEDYIAMGNLPANAIDLFREWKDSVDFHNSLADIIIGAENEDNEITVDDDGDDSATEEQGDNDQSKPSTPAPSAPSTPEKESPQQGTVITASGGNPPVKAEDVGMTFEHSLISAIAAEKGISFDEAKELYQSGNY